MFSALSRHLRRRSIRTISSVLLDQSNEMVVKISSPAKLTPGIRNSEFSIAELPSAKTWNFLSGARGFSAKSMRSKVEKRMQRESGKTLREIRRAKKLRKKLMTDEERLIYNLRRAKKKVALLLQKLKKYELPELPPPRHDPELLTPEQLQAYRKIGFRNKNYVPVGVRGVFGGVVLNMHLHWKFHETVQVCCNNFPKEKIKEMATMLARLSGGIVINIHDVKTIIMFRGRNYRQPKNLTPINTLTKRKALFKARFEQALESQKLNIKKIEQELRRKGVNPDDPIAMASIQRVASTFFSAIDKKDGSPYVFREDKPAPVESESRLQQQPQGGGDDSDQEELDRFIAEIEDAADKEWAAEEAAEKEEIDHIRYWNREDFENRERPKSWNRIDGRKIDGRVSEDAEDEEWNNHGSDGYKSEETHNKFNQQRSKIRNSRTSGFKRNGIEHKGRNNRNSYSEDVLSDLDNIVSGSDEEEERQSQKSFRSSQRHSGRNSKRDFRRDEDDLFSEPEVAEWESDATSGDEDSTK